MSVRIAAVEPLAAGNGAAVPALTLGDRFRQEIPYFAGDPPAGATPGPGEWWIDPDRAAELRDDGVLRLVSPLDSDGRAEIELSEEQEEFLDWVVTHGVRRLRLT